MASVSLSITVDNATVRNPKNVTAGTSAPGAGDIEVRVNMAKFTTLEQIYLALEQFDDFIKDAYEGPNAFGVI